MRVAVTGRRISPPLFESLELLGREQLAGPAHLRAAMTYPAYPADAGEPVPQPGPPVEPLPALPYHQLHRAGRGGWWRPVVGILLLAV